jgi:hypothetical protein
MRGKIGYKRKKLKSGITLSIISGLPTNAATIQLLLRLVLDLIHEISLGLRISLSIWFLPEQRASPLTAWRQRL